MAAGRYESAERALFADAGIEPTVHWVTLPVLGVRTRILEVGAGTPTVFLHGGPNAAATWAYLAGAVTGLHCFLVDRPGCGLSDPLPTVPNADDVPEYAAQLTVEVLDGLGIQRACLVGSSFGGYSALRSAIAHPDRVERVVLAGCPAFVPGWKAPGFFTLLRTPLLGRILLAAPATARGVRMSLKQMGHQGPRAAGRIPAPMLDWMLAWQRHTPTMRNDAAMIITGGTWRTGFAASLDLRPDDLASVKAAGQILVGANDPLGAEAVAESLATLLGTATVDVLPDAGHLPWLDDPNWVAQRITAFLSHAPG